jgi:putative DNA primase/helicase
MKTVDAAKGRWKEILTDFGIAPEALSGKHCPCPVNGEGDDRFRFSDQNGSGDFFCACSQGGKGGFALLECLTGKPFRELAQEVDVIIGNENGTTVPRSKTFAERLLDVAKPAPRSLYLESRGLEMAPGLLFAREVAYYDDGEQTGTYPAMLAPITRKGEFQTFHVTYLDKGKKAEVKNSRKILPGGATMGGAAELYPAAAVMGVAEGIETAIAAKMLFDIPTHAAISANGMEKWDPPAIAEEVHIFADHDESLTGHRAAWTLASRLVIKGLRVVVHMPLTPCDWNDVLLDSDPKAKVAAANREAFPMTAEMKKVLDKANPLGGQSRVVYAIENGKQIGKPDED